MQSVFPAFGFIAFLVLSAVGGLFLISWFGTETTTVFQQMVAISEAIVGAVLLVGGLVCGGIAAVLAVLTEPEFGKKIEQRVLTLARRPANLSPTLTESRHPGPMDATPRTGNPTDIKRH